MKSAEINGVSEDCWSGASEGSDCDLWKRLRVVDCVWESRGVEAVVVSSREASELRLAVLVIGRRW